MTVRYAVRDRIAVLTIDRPEARNAINAEVTTAMEAAIDALEADDEVLVGVLTASPPVFCAGADLKEIQAGGLGVRSTQRGGFAGIVARERRKPIIAAVDGAALAGGFEIVLSCDLVVASSNASFGLPEVKRSLIAGAGGAFRVGRWLPRSIAMEMALTGNPIDGRRAHELGLACRLTDPGASLEGALALAREIAANAPAAVRETRLLVLEATDLDDSEAWDRSTQAMHRVMSSPDRAEGLAAFTEKRAPRWGGR